MKLNIWKKRQKKNGPPSFSSLEALLHGREIGDPLRFGHLEMLPIFGSPVARDTFAPPETSIGLTKVTDYGHMELKNRSKRPTIVPLNLGYFQKSAQNHAMCRSWILAAGEEKHFTDAACIQQAQGGYIDSADDRFIVLPQPLRSKAFALRGKDDYTKLWQDIAVFNEALGLKNRGHLDELKQNYQPELLRVTYQIERQEEQTGAVFLTNDAIVGVELAPDPAFYRELHIPLVMYCYAPITLIADRANETPDTGLALNLSGLESIGHLERRLSSLYEDRRVRAVERWTALADQPLSLKKDQRLASNEIVNVTAGLLSGQAVLTNDKPAYVSLTV